MGKFASSDQEILKYSSDPWLGSALRVVSLVGMFLTNALMLNYFVKSLNQLDTLSATIGSAGMNFVCTAIFGQLCFGEELAWQWWFGASIILLGMKMLLSASGMNDDDKKQKQT